MGNVVLPAAHAPVAWYLAGVLVVLGPALHSCQFIRTIRHMPGLMAPSRIW